ncbi:MAG: FG-GAP-like repeat-containing protein, partial [Thermoanaerobaculia bacterium]
MRIRVSLCRSLSVLFLVVFAAEAAFGACLEPLELIFPQPAVGTSPTLIVAEDFDRDGRTDLAVSNLNSGDISLLLATGDGTFAPKVDYATGSASVYAVAAGDLNSDGAMDLVAANYNGGIAVLLGNGDGTFRDRSDFLAGTNPISVAIADLDRDGRPDLAVADYGGNRVSTLAGNGDGTFAAPVFVAVGLAPYSVAIADFDHDGIPDLSTTNNQSSSVSVLLGLGDGSFAAATDYPVGANDAAQRLGDLNGDGVIDIAVANFSSNTVSVLVGNGDGTFQTAIDNPVGANPISVAIADFDGDGRADLATANQGAGSVSLLLGNGDGSFAAAVDFAAGAIARSLVVLDFDRNARADLAVANFGGNNVSLLRGGCGLEACSGDSMQFTPAPGSPLAAGPGPIAVAAGDFDRDGRPDLVSADLYAGGVGLHLGNSDGSFAATVHFATGGTPYSVDASDLDHDGDLDLAVTNYEDLAILLGNGAGDFAPAVHYGAGAGPVASVAADYDGDGDLDLAVGDYFGSSVSVLTGNGDGTFAAAVAYATGGGAYQLKAADLDGDGAIDLVVPNSNGGTISVLLGMGDGTFAPQAVYATGSTASSIAIGDFDRDGAADLAVANYSSSDLSVLLGVGDGTFAPAVNYPAGVNARTVATADFDRDGWLDLVVANAGGASVSLLLGQGGGTFAARTDFAAGDGSVGLVAADLDLDGRIDLAVANLTANSLTVLRGDCALAPPPTVLSVATVFDSGNEQLEENEPTRVAIYDLIVTLSEPMANADYAVGTSGYLFTTTVLLVADGGDFTVETEGCAFGALASDAQVPIEWIYFDAASRRMTVHPAGGYLHGAHYRFFVCAGSNFIDNEGQMIDGNGDGIAGDDFVRNFQVDQSAPNGPTVLESLEHTEGECTGEPTFTMSWSGASDEPGGSGLAGYSIEWVGPPFGVADDIVDLPHGADPQLYTETLPESPGQLFRLQTCDRAGNCAGSPSPGYAIDLTGPTAPTAIHSTHDGGAPNANATVIVAFTPGVDAMCGHGGYSWTFTDSSAPSCPPAVVLAPDATQIPGVALGEGTWYFHICGIDRVGNWGPTASAGPYVIDTQGPGPVTNLQSPTHGTPGFDGEIEVTWTPPVDAIAGLAGYWWGFSDEPTYACPNVLNAPATATSAKSDVYQPGTYYFHACAVDALGNWSPAVDGGPYVVVPDPAAAQFVYFTEGAFGTLERIRTDGSERTLLIAGLNSPRGLAIDDSAGKVYWAESGLAAIRRANLDGSAIETVVSGTGGFPFDIELDLVHQKIYWTEYVDSPGAIRRANLDGSGIEDVFFSGIYQPIGLSLDLVADKIYWAESAVGGRIVRLSLSGGQVEVLNSNGGFLDVAVDPEHDRLYSTVSTVPFTGGVYRSRHDGSEFNSIPPAEPSPLMLALDQAGNRLYWTDTLTNHIERMYVTGNARETILSGPNQVRGIALSNIAMEPHETVPPTNPTSFTSTHPEDGWSNVATIGFTWSGAADEPGGSGLAGYSFVLDATPGTTPDSVIDIAQSSDPHSTALAAGEGDHFIHLVTCDVAGNCSTALEHGPYRIDLTSPSAPAIVGSSHSSTPIADTTIDISWSAAEDALSGVDGYGYLFSTAATANCPATKLVEETSLAATSAALAPGNWYFHLCAVDTAGNWSPVSTGGPYEIATTLPTVRLVDSFGQGIAGAVATYYQAGWKPFGTTGVDGRVALAIPAGSYSFRLSYGGASVQKTQHVGTNPEVLFATLDVTIRFRDSGGGTLEASSTEYYGGSWRPLGPTTGGEVHKELLPASYTFALTYLGQRNTKAQDIAANPMVQFATRDVALRFRDSAGGILDATSTEFYAGGWRSFGATVGGEAHKELLPGSYTFALTHLGQRNTKVQDVAANPAVLFETHDIAIGLRDSLGGILESSLTEFYAGGWRTFGATSGGEVHKELLPASYTFALTYLGQRNTKVQDVAANPDVLFQTRDVTIRLRDAAGGPLESSLTEF